MKKEAFVKIVESLMDAQVRREELNEKLNDIISKRDTHNHEKIDLHNLIYDYPLEDAIIDMIELEFGAWGRDRVVNYIYEQHNVYNMFYDNVRNAQELYDEIVGNSKYNKNK